jgi:hypothetical protein
MMCGLFFMSWSAVRLKAEITHPAGFRPPQRLGCVPGTPGWLRVRARAYQGSEHTPAGTGRKATGKLGEIKQVCLHGIGLRSFMTFLFRYVSTRMRQFSWPVAFPRLLLAHGFLILAPLFSSMLPPMLGVHQAFQPICDPGRLSLNADARQENDNVLPPSNCYTARMIQKSVNIRRLRESSGLDDLAFWRKRNASERVDAVETLRRQTHGSSARLQRVARVVQRAQD